MSKADVKAAAINLVRFTVALLVAGCSWFASYFAGVQALKVTAIESTASIMRNVEITLDLQFRVPEQYLEQGYRTAMAMDVDLTSLEDTKRVMPYVHAFIDTWLNEYGDIRCCTGIFVDYDWAYLEEHKDSYNDPNAFALVNVMLGDGAHYWEPVGSAGAQYITQGFKIDNTLHPAQATRYENGFMNWTPIFQRSDASKGFHYAKEIGVGGQGTPEKAWWSPVYRYDIKEPYALKAECGIPLYYPYGSTSKIGMWVIGFQIAWVSYFLRDLVSTLPHGTFIFLVEHKTGKFVASSDPEVTGLQEDSSMGEGKWPFVADVCDHSKISTPASEVVKKYGSYSGVPMASKGTDPEFLEMVINDVYSYTYVKNFVHREMDWLVFVTVPEETILGEIRKARAITLPVSLGIAAISFFLNRVASVIMANAVDKARAMKMIEKEAQTEQEATEDCNKKAQVSKTQIAKAQPVQNDCVLEPQLSTVV